MVEMNCSGRQVQRLDCQMLILEPELQAGKKAKTGASSLHFLLSVSCMDAVNLSEEGLKTVNTHYSFCLMSYYKVTEKHLLTSFVTHFFLPYKIPLGVGIKRKE